MATPKTIPEQDRAMAEISGIGSALPRLCAGVSGAVWHLIIVPVWPLLGRNRQQNIRPRKKLPGRAPARRKRGSGEI